MRKNRRFKLIAILSALSLLGIALGLVLYALRQNVSLYYTPSELLQQHVAMNTYCRVGGLVKKGSVQWGAQAGQVSFWVTDGQKDLQVRYQGVLPSLFREGQGVVMAGRLNQQGDFVAEQLLAKHDENYRPPRIDKSLERGH